MNKKLQILAHNLKDKNSLRDLFRNLNFEYQSMVVNQTHWTSEEKKTIEDSEIIAKKHNYKIYYLKTNNDSKYVKSIASKIIKSNYGMCCVCTHNPNGFKWIFSILSNTFSNSFNEIRHLPLEISPARGISNSFVKFLEKINVLNASNTELVRASISEAFDSFAIQIHDELTINVFEALKILSDGIIRYNKLDFTEKTLEMIREPIFIFLYRIIFVLYAEARSIFPVDDTIYNKTFSMEYVKQEWILKTPEHLPQDSVHQRLKGLFKLIEKGSESLGYDRTQFFMRSYYGKLFDRDIHSNLEIWKISNQTLLSAINLLTRTRDKHGYFLLDYYALETRHLGSIYERILEYQLTINNGKISSLVDVRERKTSGSYYTPKLIVDHIVEHTIGPLITQITKNTKSRASQINQIFDLKILDPAMGSGHFLVSAVNYVATRICQIENNDTEYNYVERKREVARKCIYGVDINPLAVDLAMVTLWLETLSSEKPLSFLSAHLKHGNSLVGSSISSIFDAQTTITEFEQEHQYFKESVIAFLAFESDDNTPQIVKKKIHQYQNMRSKGTLYHDLKVLLDYKTSESFGNKISTLGDYRAKIGQGILDYSLNSTTILTS